MRAASWGEDNLAVALLGPLKSCYACEGCCSVAVILLTLEVDDVANRSGHCNLCDYLAVLCLYVNIV